MCACVCVCVLLPLSALPHTRSLTFTQQVFFTLISAIIGSAIFHGIFVLPVLASLIGPSALPALEQDHSTTQAGSDGALKDKDMPFQQVGSNAELLKQEPKPLPLLVTRV